MSITFIVYIGSLISFTTSQICQDQIGFDDYCATEYNGIAVGGHCYFLARNPAKTGLELPQWEEAFDVCSKQGPDNPKFAQVYSNAELEAIKEKFIGDISWPPGGWVALGNKPAVDQGTPVINGERTRWYDDTSSPVTSIGGNNTFLRLHAMDDPLTSTGSGECIILFIDGGVIKFGDEPCKQDKPTLCMITNSRQGFHLADGCFGEAPIQSYVAPNEDLCATFCANEVWCRTFNFHRQPPNNVCELFALHVADATGSVKYGVNECSMYTFDT